MFKKCALLVGWRCDPLRSYVEVANVEKILKLVTSINVKEKECDFFRLYVYLVLMDNLLFSSDAFRDKTGMVDAWRNYLRNCSTQIGCTDWRFYAPKVRGGLIDASFLHAFIFPLLCLLRLMQARNKASYLLQGSILKKSSGDGKSCVR